MIKLILTTYMIITLSLIILVHVVFIALVLRFLRKNYHDLWLEAGSPKFWSSRENIEEIIAIKDNVNCDRPLARVLSIFSTAKLILDILLVGGGVFSIFTVLILRIAGEI